MALYTKSWWKKLFGKTEKIKKIDILENINSVKDYLSDSSNDVKILLKELDKLKELEKEYEVAKSGIIQINLETQSKILDRILERYEFYQNDADINGIRIKQLATTFLERAEKNGLKDLVKQKKKDNGWLLNW
ncbi:MAG: hypothetical protein KKA62_00135 [Nanoarchaeota archaeon]|nr:hypothetical protein [Nanoarchaeota archaeon]MBU1644332.1 hypothetical protein [Nanoarchaeota archaeon]MBU1976345.1 hypothetical protein [Nanoarchaeota archaeon]